MNQNLDLSGRIAPPVTRRMPHHFLRMTFVLRIKVALVSLQVESVIISLVSSTNVMAAKVMKSLEMGEVNVSPMLYLLMMVRRMALMQIQKIGLKQLPWVVPWRGGTQGPKPYVVPNPV